MGYYIDFVWTPLDLPTPMRSFPKIDKDECSMLFDEKIFRGVHSSFCLLNCKWT